MESCVREGFRADQKHPDVTSTDKMETPTQTPMGIWCYVPYSTLTGTGTGTGTGTQLRVWVVVTLLLSQQSKGTGI
jgi:hypothetical protein